MFSLVTLSDAHTHHTSLLPDSGDQPAGHHQQPDPGEEVRLRGVRRPAGGLSGQLRHYGSVKGGSGARRVCPHVTITQLISRTLSEVWWCCVVFGPFGGAIPDLSSSPPGPYGQEHYVFKPEERFKAPPILPPHLLQVILNKDTNISVRWTSLALQHFGLTFWPFQL